MAPLLVSAPLAAAPATYRIDPEHCSIAFLVDHMGYEKMIGMFTDVSGEFVYDEAKQHLASGHVEIQSASVDTHHRPRDGHLRSGDFLDSERHPLIRFVAREYRPGAADGVLRGDLTLLGQTRPVELSVRLNRAAKYPFGHGRHTLGISARGSIRRSEFGMTYGVANDMVGDEVELLIEFEAWQE